MKLGQKNKLDKKKQSDIFKTSDSDLMVAMAFFGFLPDLELLKGYAAA